MNVFIGFRCLISVRSFYCHNRMPARLFPFCIAFFLAVSFSQARQQPGPLHSSASPAGRTTGEGETRSQLLLDFGWKFHLGDAADPDSDFGFGRDESFAKAGETSGPATPGFNDSSWRTLDLPHDWAAELDFVHVKDPTLHDHGFKPLGRQFPRTSIGWYRRFFMIPASDSGNILLVKFDGVFRDCVVWLNGHYLGRNLGGYGEFSFDISDYLRFGGTNVLVLRVDATQAEGWFYEGAGIYRHTWLLKYPRLHVPLYGVFVRSTVVHDAATIAIDTKITNQTGENNGCTLYTLVLDDQRKEIARVPAKELRFGDFEEKNVSQNIRLPNPRLWSPDDPYCYTLLTTLKNGKTIIDRLETPFGIRTIRFDKERGFFLNGRRLELKGVCCHQDHAGVGSALPDRLQYFRIEKLKEMGCNAYRSSHNPPASELLDACDRLGMLVMDENRLMGSTEPLLGQFKTQLLRDRNHPSVFLWSLGNEEWQIQDNATGTAIARSLKRLQKEIDPSRLCTYAGNNGNQYEGVNSVVDVRGINYIVLGDPDRYHSEHPDQPVIGSEEASTLCTRGIYQNDTVNGFVSDDDVNHPRWGTTAETWWKFYHSRPWLGGAFVWTGFDYRGEPTPYSWPCISSHFGIMDACGFPKNNYYYYQSWWRDDNFDVLRIAPHWNWRGREGQLLDVWCRSNCDSVELVLNGRSLGRKTMDRDSHLEWNVTYEPGTLQAKGWRKGRLLTTGVETTDSASSIRLVPDRTSIDADNADLSVVTVTALDAAGREVPDARNLIRFELEGDAKIIGVGNGNPSSHEPDKCSPDTWQRRLFNGKCQVIIQAGRKPGTIRLQAFSDGLKSAAGEITTRPSPGRPVCE